MIFDRHLTPGDGQADVDICGFPHHGILQIETIANTPINGGAALEPFVTYQLGISAEFPAGMTHIHALRLSEEALSVGEWGSYDVAVWLDLVNGLILSRFGIAGPVTATLSVKLLTLPNGTRRCMEWAIEEHDLMKRNGDSYLLRPLGQPVVTRTPAQSAQDTIDGKQWLNGLIGYGPYGQFGGAILLGGYSWFYAAGDGTKWRVSVVVTQDDVYSDRDNYDFTFSRLDRVEVHTWRSQVIDPTTYTYGFTSGFGGTTCPPPGTNAEAVLTIEDIRQDGADAVLGWRNFCPNDVGLSSMQKFLRDEPVSLYFMRASITGGAGGISATVSMLYDPPTTLGSYTDDATHIEYKDRIIAVWYDPNGDPLPVKLERDFAKATQTVSIPTKTSGTWSASTSGAMTWTMTWGVQSAVWSCAMTHTKETTVVATMISADPEQWSYSCSSESAGSINFEGVITASYALRADDSCTHTSVTASLREGFRNAWNWDSSVHREQPQGAYHGSGYIQAPGAKVSDGAGYSAMWAIKRLSNKYFGLVAMRFPVALPDPQSDWDKATTTPTNYMIWIGGFSPSGKDGAPQILGVLPPHPYWPGANTCPSGAYNSASNVVARRNDGAPICFI